MTTLSSEAVRLADVDTDPLYQRLMGRIEYLLKIKRVKDPELMMTTVEVLTDIADAAKGLAEIAREMDNGTNPGQTLRRTAMSHHGNNPNPQLHDAMRKLFGEFPDGKLNEDDSGAVAMAVGVENNRVVLRFPKPCAWVGMTGDEAFELAQMLLKHARHAGVTAPLIIRVGG